MEALIVVLLLAVLVVAGAGVALLIRAQGSQTPDAEARQAQQMEQMRLEQERQQQQAQQFATLRSELAQTLNQNQTAVLGQVNALDAKMSQQVASVQSSVGKSLSSTQDTIVKIGEQLGGLSEAAKRIQDVGQDVSSLKDVLQPPKLRGIFGELLLEQLLAQVLPAANFTMQHRFSDGTIVDAVVRTPDGLVPIDSKFPIDSYRRLLEAANDEERERLRKEFVRDVRNRVVEVTKYIQPSENTMDFALMYIPAEAIFYELISGSTVDESMTFALERQVHLVSPNTFYMLLQTLARTLQRMQVQENVEKFRAQVAHVGRDFQRFQAEFATLGKHISNAKNKHDELGRWSDKIEGGLQLAAPQDEDGALPEHLTDQPALPESVPVNGNDDAD